MCGIVGYVGKKDCTFMLLDGLKRLEYRGYDSAGLALHNGEKVEILKRSGKIYELETALTSLRLHGHTGIGHTRWATHGSPTEKNAHPHKIGSIAVVHNGIIENFIELKHMLEKEGAIFLSETDTEIFAHLIERYSEKDTRLIDAVQLSLKHIRGAYAIAVISDKEPSTIVVAKNASPLVIGIGKEETFLASDIPAILPYTRKIVFLEEGEIAELKPGKINIITEEGKPVTRKSKLVTWSPSQAEKGEYKHFMLKEIHEQPRAVEDTVFRRISLEDLMIKDLEIGLKLSLLSKFQRIILVACGTSYHAALCGKFWIENLAGIPTEVDLASEYRYRNPIIGPRDLFVAISQSGETADTLAALQEANQKGASSLALVNVIDSVIARLADGAFYTYAGPEIGVASTKCFTAQLAALLLLAIYFGERTRRLKQEEAKRILKELIEIPRYMREVLRQETFFLEIARKYANKKNFLYLGRGLNFAIALEGALKLKEISYIHAEGYAAGEMKHGPIALIDENMPVVALIPQDDTYEKLLSNLQEVRARDGTIIAIATKGDTKINKLAQEIIYLPLVDKILTPFVFILPLQLIAYYIADFLGTDVDQPRNLAKTVTVE